MKLFGLASCCFLALVLASRSAGAVASAELYASAASPFGRYEARVRFAAGDGVVSSFFLWKDGSEQSGVFWNELDYEKLGADCHVQTNALYGNPVGDHGQQASLGADPCGGFHVYAYEWLPESITWFVDGAQIRQETGETARAYADNAPNGMAVHFNIWPGDASFGGNFSPSILPVHQYIDWVQFSSYADGVFTLGWRQDFDGATVPTGWLTGNWGSPKNLSTHSAENVSFIDGYAVLSLTADDATGPGGALPGDGGGAGGSGGAPPTGGVGGDFGVGGRSGGEGGASGAAGSSSAGTSTQAGQTGRGGMASSSGGGGLGGAGQPSQGGTNFGGTGAAQAGSPAAVSGAPTTAGASTGGSASEGGTAGQGISSGTNDGADSESGCGCRQERSRGPLHHGTVGIMLGVALMGASRRRRRAR